MDLEKITQGYFSAPASDILLPEGFDTVDAYLAALASGEWKTCWSLDLPFFQDVDDDFFVNVTLTHSGEVEGLLLVADGPEATRTVSMPRPHEKLTEEMIQKLQATPLYRCCQENFMVYHEEIGDFLTFTGCLKPSDIQRIADKNDLDPAEFLESHLDYDLWNETPLELREKDEWWNKALVWRLSLGESNRGFLFWDCT